MKWFEETTDCPRRNASFLFASSFLLQTCRLAVAGLLGASLTVQAESPSGGKVVGGSGSISQSGLRTTIHQNTSSLAIDWDSFNVSKNAQVDFIQPGASSIALNRIFSQSASEIHGKINANGHVVLVNPYGVLFGQTASLNVGGLVASSVSINPNDFMNGNYSFNEMEGVDGSVINYGLINATGGLSYKLKIFRLAEKLRIKNRMKIRLKKHQPVLSLWHISKLDPVSLYKTARL